MAEPVKLIGLDFGTTTSSAVVASANLRRTGVGKTELDFHEELFRSAMVFTPMLDDDRLDLVEVERLLDSWLEAGQVREQELFGGGALLTGLTAQKTNAPALVTLIRRRLGDALIATADDPCLESWLAFMGSCASLSRDHPERFILNFDIGGGTTNIALGLGGQVSRTGCLFLGARHVQVNSGTYRIVRLSPYARDIFAHLGIQKTPGQDLTSADVDSIVTFCVTLLESIVGNRGVSTVPALTQAAFSLPGGLRDPVVTFSGGVGELIYRHVQGIPWPGTTCYGDLGIDLARRIVASPMLAQSLQAFRPESAGRATVYGLLRYTTEVSGNTLFLGARDLLPLADVPILGRWQGDASEERIRDVLALVRHSSRGGAVQVQLGSHVASDVRRLGERIANVVSTMPFPETQPLVLLVEENVGKVLGQYVTRWGALPLRILVIDEIVQRDAQYVQIGSPREQVVPVSFYGITGA